MLASPGSQLRIRGMHLGHDESLPLNFLIHGPMLDCWRFTEHGFEVLLRDFEILEIDILEAPGRDLFPVQYNVLAKNDKLRRTCRYRPEIPLR